MSCKQFEKYIDLYIDGMLQNRDREEFENHLVLCSKCKDSFKRAKWITDIMRDLDEEPLPKDFRSELFKKLEEAPSGQKSYRVRWVGILAGIVVILLSVKIIGNIGRMDRTGMDNKTSNNALYDEDSMPEESIAQAPVQKQKEEDGGLEYAREGSKESESLDELGDEASIDLDARVQKQIQSNEVAVYVEDICITPQTLKFMAVNNDMDVLESDEESITIGITNEEQRYLLYNELAKMGYIEETGEDLGDNRIKVIIKSKE